MTKPSNSSSFELPEANEKLAFKFILDAQKESALKKLFPDSLEEAGIETAIPLETQAEESLDTRCGTEAEVIDPVTNIPIETTPFQELSLPAGKKYFRIGEVSEIIGVEPYVLRYWEGEFKSIKPVKSSAGHRVYSRKDVETLHQIRRLLHVEKFSIKGAKQKIAESRKKSEPIEMGISATKQRETLKSLSQELKELIQTIRATSF